MIFDRKNKLNIKNNIKKLSKNSGIDIPYKLKVQKE